MMYGVGQFGYLVASALFIFALHWMNTPATARKGVYAGGAGTAGGEREARDGTAEERGNRAGRRPAATRRVAGRRDAPV